MVDRLVSNVKRKNIETIAYLHEQDRQPLQKFIGQNPWDHRPLIDELARQIGATLGQTDGVLHEELQSNTLKHLCERATRLNRRKQATYFYYWKNANACHH